MSLGDLSTPTLETDPHAYIPPLQAYSEWSSTTGSHVSDSLTSYQGYADYQRGHFFRTGEIDDEVEQAIQQGFHTNILGGGLTTPEELQKPEVAKSFMPLGASVEAETNLVRSAFGEEAGATYLQNKQGGAGDQSELTNQLNMAKSLLVDTGQLSFASITDDQGRTKIISGGEITDRNRALDDSVRAGAMSYSHAYLAADGLKQGASERSTRFQDRVRANIHDELGALLGSDANEDSDLHNVVDEVAEIIKGQDTADARDPEALNAYVGRIRAGLSRNYGKKNSLSADAALNRYSDKQIKNALEEKTALEVNASKGFKYYEDDDTKNIRVLSSGLALAHPTLMEHRGRFEKAVENDSRLSQSQRSMLRNSRNLFRERAFPHFDKILSDTSATSDEWLAAKQAGRVNGVDDVDTLDTFLSNEDNYSSFTNRAGALGASVWDGIAGMFASVGAIVFKSEGATQYLVEAQRAAARRREVAALFTDDFGWFMDLGETIAPMVTDVAATLALSAASFGAGGVAYVSLKTGARVGARGLVKSMTGRLLRKQFGETAEQAANNLVAKGLIKASTDKAAKEGAQKAIVAYNKAISSKFWPKAVQLPASFLVNANRSAGGTYATIYGAQPDGMTHAEKHDAALGYALISGMTTGLITIGFSAIGRGGFEDALLGGMSSKGMTGAMERLGRVKFTGKGAKKLNEKVADVVTAKIKEATKRRMPEFVRGGLNEALEEGSDEFVQTFIMDVALNENTPMIDRVMTALHAASLGGALGAGASGIRSVMDRGRGSQYVAYEQKAVDDLVESLKSVDSPLSAAEIRKQFTMAARDRPAADTVPTIDLAPEEAAEPTVDGAEPTVDGAEPLGYDTLTGEPIFEEELQRIIDGANMTEEGAREGATPTTASAPTPGMRLPKELEEGGLKYVDHPLKYESQIDQAAYIIAPKKSGEERANRYNDYLAFVMEAGGLTKAQAIAHGVKVKATIAKLSKADGLRDNENISVDRVALPSTTTTAPAVYTAAVLDQSEDALGFWRGTVKEPLLSKTYAHHMTIDFKPTDEQFNALPLGEDVELKVIGYAADSKAQVLVVEPVGVSSSNAVAHVTIATDGNTKPAYSNKLLAQGYTTVDGPVLNARVGYVDSKRNTKFAPPTTRQSQAGAVDKTPEQIAVEQELEQKRIEDHKNLVNTFDNLWNDEVESAKQGGDLTPEEHYERAERWAAEAEQVAMHFGMDSRVERNTSEWGEGAFKVESRKDGMGMEMVINLWGLARLTAGMSQGNAQHMARTETYHEVIHRAAWHDLMQEEIDELFLSLPDSQVNETIDTYYLTEEKRAESREALASPLFHVRRAEQHNMVDELLRMKAQRILKGFTSEQDLAFYKSNPNFLRVFLRYLTSVLNRMRAARELDSGNPALSAALSRLTGEMARMNGAYRVIPNITFDVADPEKSVRTLASQFGEATPERQFLFEEDEKYLELAKNEEANQEDLQLMVDERAKEAGITNPIVHHGSPKIGFTEFKMGHPKSHVWSAERGIAIHFARNPKMSAPYADPNWDYSDGLENIKEGEIRNFYLMGRYAKLEHLPSGTQLVDPDTGEVLMNVLEVARMSPVGIEIGQMTPSIIATIKAFGFDGVYDENIASGENDVYAIFDPRKVKLADPVTRDDDGNVIPLSQRFDISDADIRYSQAGAIAGPLHPTPIEFPAELLTQAGSIPSRRAGSLVETVGEGERAFSMKKFTPNAPYSIEGTEGFEGVEMIDAQKVLEDFREKNNGREPKVWVWMGDQLKRGEYNNPKSDAKVQLEGGIGYAIDPENVKAGRVWASGLDMDSLHNNSEDADFIWIASGSPEGAHNFSKGTSKVIVAEIIQAMKKMRSKTRDKTFTYGKGKNKKTITIKSSKSRKPLSDSEEFAEFAKIMGRWLESGDTPLGLVQAALESGEGLVDGDGNNRINFAKNLLAESRPKDGWTMNSDPHNRMRFIHDFLGIPSKEKLREGILEPFNVKNNIQQGDLTILLKPTRADEGKGAHDTYEHAVLGTVVGMPTQRFNIFDIASDKIASQVMAEDHEGRRKMILVPTRGRVYEGLKMDETPDREINMGISVYKDRASYDEDVATQARESLTEALKGIEGIVDAVIHPTEGVYFGDREPSFDVRITAEEGASLTAAIALMNDFGAKHGQYDVFMTEEVDNTHPNARPGVKILFKNPVSDSDISTLSDSFLENDLKGFTILKDGQGNSVGVTSQFIPEFDARYGKEGGGMDVTQADPNVVESSFRKFKQNAVKLSNALTQGDKFDIASVSTVYYNSAVYGKEEYTRPVIEPLGSRRLERELGRRVRSLEPPQERGETPTTDTAGAENAVQRAREQERLDPTTRGSQAGSIEPDRESITENARAHTYLKEEYDPWDKEQGISIYRNGVKLTGVEAYHAIKQEDEVIEQLRLSGIMVDTPRNKSRFVASRQAAIDFLKGRGYSLSNRQGERLSQAGSIPAKTEAEYMEIANVTKPTKGADTATKQLWTLVQEASRKAESVVPKYFFYDRGSDRVEVIKNPSPAEEDNIKEVEGMHTDAYSYIVTPSNVYLFDREKGEHGSTAKALGLREWMGITRYTNASLQREVIKVAEYTSPSPLYWDSSKGMYEGEITKVGAQMLKEHFPDAEISKPKPSSLFNPILMTTHTDITDDKDGNEVWVETQVPATLSERFAVSTTRYSQAGGLDSGDIPRYNPNQAGQQSPLRYGSVATTLEMPFFDTGKYHKKRQGGMKWLNAFTGGTDPRVQRLLDQNKQANRAVKSDIDLFTAQLKFLVKKEYTDKGLPAPVEFIRAISGSVEGLSINEDIQEQLDAKYGAEVAKADRMLADGTLTLQEATLKKKTAEERRAKKEKDVREVLRRQFDAKKNKAIDEFEGGLNNPIVKHVLALRSLVDEMSGTLKKLFGHDVELGATMDANMDIYLHRSYRIFTEVDYARKVLGNAKMSAEEAKHYGDIRERAGQVFRKSYVEHRTNQLESSHASRENARLAAEEEVKNDPAIVNGLIMDYIQSLTGGTKELSLMGVRSSPKSRKGISNLVTGGLMKRTNPPEEIRELLGEHEDTTGYNTLLRTYMHVGLMASKQAFAQHMFDLGTRSGASGGKDIHGNPQAMSDPENKWIFTQSEMDAMTPEERASKEEELGSSLVPIRVGGDSAAQFDPFRRNKDVGIHYAPEEMTLGIAAILKHSAAPILESEADVAAKALISVASRATGLSLGAKTLGSIGFYVRNVVSNVVFFGPSQGFLRFGKMNKQFKTEMGRFLKYKTPQEVSAFHRTMISLGVGGNEMKKRLIEELIEKTPTEASLLGELNQTLDDFREAGGDKKKITEIVADSKVGKIYEKLKELSATVDVFYKIAYFLHEAETLQRAQEHSKKHGLNDKYSKMSPFQLMDAAAEKVKRTAQSYDQAPPIVAGAQKTWFGTFFAPFLRFKIEVPRIILNTIVLSKQEISDKNPVIRARGVKRLAGMSSVIGGASLLLPLALRGMAGIGDDEDEALRDSMPDYLRTHTFFYFGKGKKLTSWDITYLNPYAMMVDPFARAFEQVFRGNPAKAGAQFAESLLANNFLDDQILSGAVMDLKSNRNPKNDKPIWEENDTAWDAAYKSASFLLDASYNPRTPKNIWMNGFKKLQEEGVDDLNILTTPAGALLSEFKPVRQHELNLEKQFDSFLSARRAEYSRISSRKNMMLKDNPMDADEIRELAADEVEHRRRINQHLAKTIRGFTSLGLTNADIYAQAKDKGYGKRRMALLFAGLMDRPALKKPFVERMVSKGDVHIQRLREYQKELDTYSPYISL